MKKIIYASIYIAAALMASTCTRPDRAEEVLVSQGYTDIDIQGHAWFACSEDDTFKTRFEATSPNGTRVKGAVCDGWFKGATVRITGNV